jgi:hypothetical protein
MIGEKIMFYNKKIFKRCFDWPARYWYKNIKRIPLYFKLMHHLVKYGYDEYAHWETFNWFIDTMKPILMSYITDASGYPCEFETPEEWHKILNHMIELLDSMDENSPKYEADDYMFGFEKKYNAINEAKDEFFKLFAEYFYNLWD